MQRGGYLCPCSLSLEDGMRMGSSSLSSESWVPRLGWLFASPAGSDLLQPPDVSSVASDSAVSVAAEAADPPSNTLSAEVETEEVLLEQEASHGASATEAGSLRCPEDSEGAEGGESKQLIHHICHVNVNQGFAPLELEINLWYHAHLAPRLNSPGSAQPLPGLLWDGRRPEDPRDCCSCGERRSHLCQSLQTRFRAVFFFNIK